MNHVKYSEKLKHPRWQKKRLDILNRDQFKCQQCGDEETELHVHHLEYTPGGNPWDIDNDKLITLCKICHGVVEGFKRYADIIFIEKYEYDEQTVFLDVFSSLKDDPFGKYLQRFEFVNGDYQREVFCLRDYKILDWAERIKSFEIKEQENKNNFRIYIEALSKQFKPNYE